MVWTVHWQIGGFCCLRVPWLVRALGFEGVAAESIPEGEKSSIKMICFSSCKTMAEGSLSIRLLSRFSMSSNIQHDRRNILLSCASYEQTTARTPRRARTYCTNICSHTVRLNRLSPPEFSEPQVMTDPSFRIAAKALIKLLLHSTTVATRNRVAPSNN